MSSRTWLRRSRAGTVVLAAGVLFAACQDAEIVAPEAAPAATPASLSDPLARRVADLGFRTDMIVDEGDHFRVEGDIIIPKNELVGPRAQSRPGGPVFQWHTNALVAQTKMAQGLRVNLSPIAGNAGWLAAARSAMNHWSWTYGTRIYLVEGGPADITFSFASLPSGTLAQASFPASGNPGGVVQISTAYNSLASSRKLWVLVHEIGHTLGYRHSNWDDLNEENIAEHYTVGANFIPNTLYTDPNSVMTGGVGSRTWSGFSSYDNIGNQYLYPAQALTLTTSTYDASHHGYLEWNVVPDVAYYRVSDTTYYWEFVYYDPQASSDGYWTWVSYPGSGWNVTGTSFTAPYPSANPPYGGCYVQFDVNPVYPSGKYGSGSSTTFDCP